MTHVGIIPAFLFRITEDPSIAVRREQLVWIIVGVDDARIAGAEVVTTLYADAVEVRRDEDGTNMGDIVLKRTSGRLHGVPCSKNIDDRAVDYKTHN